MADAKVQLRDGHARLEDMIEEAHLEDARTAAMERPWMKGLVVRDGLRDQLQVVYDRIAEALTPDERGLRDVLVAREECARASQILDASG